MIMLHYAVWHVHVTMPPFVQNHCLSWHPAYMTSLYSPSNYWN